MTEINFIPAGTRILVTPIEKPKETKSESGIITAVNDAVEVPTVGIVVAAGPEVEMAVAGTKVAYGYHSGREIIVDGKRYLLMREGDVDGFYKV